MQPLVLLPAVHVSAGRAVRLNDPAQPDTDPVQLAAEYAGHGADWLQVIDVDAARGTGRNDAVLRDILAATRGTQVGVAGGIRDDATLEGALAAGAARVTVGTSAVRDPEWAERLFQRHGERVAIGLDVRDGRVLAHGSEDAGDASEAVEQMTALGCPRFVVRCLASDGRLTGPSYELLGSICARTGAAVVASGGISSLEDLRRLRGLVPIGVEGVVVGTALTEGRFSLDEALEITRGERPLHRPLSPVSAPSFTLGDAR